jgi:hypothetical protein
LPDNPDNAVSAANIHQALTQGFGWVMVYGGIGVWLLAALSFFVFGYKEATTSSRQ